MADPPRKPVGTALASFVWVFALAYAGAATVVWLGPRVRTWIGIALWLTVGANVVVAWIAGAKRDKP